MPSVFWLAAYNPLLTWAPLTQQAMANDCWAVTFLFQNTPPVERGTCSFTYGMGFCLGTQFFCYELFFLKKCAAATVAKKKKKPETLERKERGWTHRNWDAILVLARHRKVEKHSVGGPTKIYHVGQRGQSSELTSFYAACQATPAHS